MFKQVTIIALILFLQSVPCDAQTRSDSANHDTVTFAPALRTIALEANTYYPFLPSHEASFVVDCDFIQLGSTCGEGIGLRLRYERHSDLWQGGESPGYAYASGASALIRYSASSSFFRGDILSGLTSVTKATTVFKGKSALVLAWDMRLVVVAPLANVHFQIAAFYGRDPVKQKWTLALPGFLIGIGLGYFN